MEWRRAATQSQFLHLALATTAPASFSLELVETSTFRQFPKKQSRKNIVASVGAMAVGTQCTLALDVQQNTLPQNN